jgi:hypothetical protein
VNYTNDLWLLKIRIFLQRGLDILNMRFGKTTRRANQATQSIPEQSALKPGKTFIAQMRANSQSEMPSRRMFRNEKACHSIAPARCSRWNIPSIQSSFLEDDTMEIAEQITAQREVKNYDMSILLGYSIFAIVVLIVIYFDSMSPGTASADFASMTVFP